MIEEGPQFHRDVNFLSDLLEAGMSRVQIKAVLITSLGIAIGIPDREVGQYRETMGRMIATHANADLAARYQEFVDWIVSSKIRQGRVSVPTAMRSAVVERDGNECVYCGDKEGPFHLDHIWPVWRGGETSIDNLVVACRRCNLWKSGSTIQEWKGTQ